MRQDFVLEQRFHERGMNSITLESTLELCAEYSCGMATTVPSTPTVNAFTPTFFSPRAKRKVKKLKKKWVRLELDNDISSICTLVGVSLTTEFNAT